MVRARLLAAASVFALAATAASAADTEVFTQPDASRFGFGNYSDQAEVRFGVLAYDLGFFSQNVYDGVMLNGEIVFRSPEFLDFFGAPRPYVGFDAAISDDPVHFFYAGVTWDFSLTNRLYVSGSLGGSIHTDDQLVRGPGLKSLGTRALFHLGLAVGFDVTPNWTVQAYLDHFSNANLGPTNDGFENSGIRIGYRF